MSDIHAQTVPYVAETMLPEQTAPRDAVGPAAWLRENLFSSVANAITTILSLAVIVWLVVKFAPWFLNGVWDAGSLNECREILAGETGACFAVLVARFNQLMFGFYDTDQIWRPILILALFVPAVAPVLGEGSIRRFWPLSVAYPLFAFYLIFGGSIWGIVSFLVGLGVGYAAFRLLRGTVSGPLAALGAALVTVVFWLFAVDPLATELRSALGYVGLRSIDTAKMGGVLLAMILGVSGIVLSFPIGILLALGRQSDMPVVKMLCVGFIEFFRGVPLITLLFVASTLLNYFLPPSTDFDLLLRVVILVVIFASAYMAEVIRGGLAAVPKGQYEAAQAMGLPYWDSMRLIVLPQALKISIPGIVSTFIGLFKDTTLVSIIGLYDILGIRTAIDSSPQWRGIFWELLFFAGAFFFVCCFAMSRYSMYVERKLDTGHRN